jgi:hypothetical protein
VPDVVVLQWGTNDTVLRVPHGEFVADFIESAELLRIAGAVAIVVKPIGFAPLASLDPSIDPEVRGLLRVFLKDTVKQQRAVAIAARNLGLPHCAVRTRPRRFWLDAFHPTLDAYRDLVAPQLAACIRRFAGL